MRVYRERFRRGRRGRERERESGRRLEWNEERGKIIKRESTKNDLLATWWNNFPANTVATFKRHCMHRFLWRGANERGRNKERKTKPKKKIVDLF